MPKQLDLRIQYKYDKESNWNSLGSIPPSGELLFYEPSEEHDKTRLKIGDGLHVPVELPWAYIGEYGNVQPEPEEPEQPTSITSVRLRLTGLQRGNRPEDTTLVSDTEGCYGSIISWNTTSEFEENTTYTASVRLESNDGYVFGPGQVSAEVVFGEDIMGNMYLLQTATNILDDFEIEFTCPDDPAYPADAVISSVDLTISNYQNGSKVSNITISPTDTEQYTMETVWKYGYTILTSSDTLVGGRTYNADITLKNKSGFTFDNNNISVMINNKSVMYNYVTENEKIVGINFSYDVTVARETVQYPTSTEFIYDGESHTPIWNYDVAKMYPTAISSGIDAGTYYSTFAVEEGYCWPNGTYSTAEIEWVINKATITNIVNAADKTVTITNLKTYSSYKAFDLEIPSYYQGEISLENRSSIHESIETEILNNNGSYVVIVDGQFYTGGLIKETGYFDIKLSGDKNCNETSVTITVYTEMASTNLNENDWSVINTAAINDTALYIWSIGDVKVVNLSNYKIKTSDNVERTLNADGDLYAYIIDFNRDGTKSIEFQGFKMWTGQTGLEGYRYYQDVALVDNDYEKTIDSQNLLGYTGYAFSLNSELDSGEAYNTEYGPPSWVHLYNRALIPMYNSFDDDLKGVILTIDSVNNLHLNLWVKYGDGGYITDESGLSIQRQDNNNEGFKLILPSCGELSSSATYFCQTEGVDWGDLLTLSSDDSETYQYYKSGGNYNTLQGIKKYVYNRRTGITEWAKYWTRDIVTYTSWFANQLEDPSTSFSSVYYQNYTDGDANIDMYESEVSDRSYAVTPIFRVGNPDYIPSEN